MSALNTVIEICYESRPRVVTSTLVARRDTMKIQTNVKAGLAKEIIGNFPKR